MKTIFWNVDTQYDFMRDDGTHKGALPVPGAREIEPNLEKLTQYAVKNRLQIVNTADFHTPESEELSEEPDFITTFPPHCLRGTKGAEFIPATRPRLTTLRAQYAIDWREERLNDFYLEKQTDIIIYKDAFDVFTGNPHTEKVLEIINPDRAVVYGVATNVCVDFAVKGLLERGIEVYVPLDAIKELPNLPLEETLKEWERRGAYLTTTDDVLKYATMQTSRR